MSDPELEPLGPAEAIDWYLEHRQEEVRIATLSTHEYALNVFERWASEVGLDNLNELNGRKLAAYKKWRTAETDIKRISLNGTMGVLKQFIKFCEQIEAVPDGLADRVPVPNVPTDEEVKTIVPEDDEVQSIRESLGRFQYASRQHLEYELVAEVGIRLGALRAIDLGDLDLEEQRIQLRHRPEGPEDPGTPLKNGTDGERLINISDRLRKLVSDYMDHNRHEVIDKYDRHPLLTTPEGRISQTTIRRDFYKLTRPCEYSGECPHDRTIESCEATKSSNAAACPSSFTTHPLRKWSIMNQLQEGVPKEILSDRVDVSVPVLNKHYDQRSEERKSAQRQRVLEANIDEYQEDAQNADR